MALWFWSRNYQCRYWIIHTIPFQKQMHSWEFCWTRLSQDNQQQLRSAAIAIANEKHQHAQDAVTFPMRWYLFIYMHMRSHTFHHGEWVTGWGWVLIEATKRAISEALIFYSPSWLQFTFTSPLRLVSSNSLLHVQADPFGDGNKLSVYWFLTYWFCTLCSSKI